jgi:hypothetical protein
MTRHRKEPARVDRTQAGLSASDRRARGKKRARRDTEPYGPAREPETTEAEWRAYREGPKPTEEQVQAIRGGSRSMGVREGYKASELGLRPRDWEDPRYRLVYAYFMIFREDAEDDAASAESPEESALSLEASGDPEWETVLIGPGRHSIDVLLSFIARFAGKGLELRHPYDPAHDYAVVRTTKTMKRLMAKRGFHIDELKLDFTSAPV